MRAWMTAVVLVMAVPVAGCSDSDTAKPATIPLTIKAPDKTHVFTVEVARTPEEQAKGLMFRTSLPENGGMLFPFEKPRRKHDPRKPRTGGQRRRGDRGARVGGGHRDAARHR